MEGSTHAMGMLSSVASAARLAQQAAAALDHSVGPFVVMRSYDLTPMRVQFGNLQDRLAPSARFLVPCSPVVAGQGPASPRPKRWKAVTLSEYQKFKNLPKHYLPQKGVVELMAQHAVIGYQEPGTARYVEQDHDIPPRFCERGNSSTIFRAVETALPMIDSARLIDRARHVRFVIYSEIADAAGSNARKQAETMRRLPENVLAFAGACSGHRVHSVVSSTTKEKKIIGDVHAVAYAAGLPTHHEMLLKAYRTLLDKPGYFKRYVGLPLNLDHRKHARAMWQHCKHRHLFMIRGRLHEGIESKPSRKIEHNNNLSDKFLSMWNGDLRLPEPYHICVLMDNGRWCCDSEQEAREKFFAVGIEAGVLLDSSEQLPSSNRWGTCTETMSHEVAALHFHNALGQSAQVAFPHWSSAVADAVDGDDPDDIAAQRQYVRSKTRRFVKVCSSAERRRNMLATAWVCAPLDHANQRLQHLGAQRGKTLEILDNEASPLTEAQRAFKSMLSDRLEDGPLSTVVWYYGFKAALLDDLRALVLSMSAQLWYRFLDLGSWPLRLLRMVDPRCTDPTAVAKELYDAKTCCLDEHMSQKARRLFPDPEAMAGDAEFLSMLRYWAEVLKLDSMHVERLLAQIKASVPTDCKNHLPQAEQLLGAGYLTQLRKKHCAIMGSDAGMITRKRLLESNAPLRCAPAQGARSTPTSLTRRGIFSSTRRRLCYLVLK